MSVLGAIEIQMLADLARLKQDMDAAKSMVADATTEMQRYADKVGTALGALGVVLSVGAFRQMVQDNIDAAESLKDLGIQTGVTVESLSGLAEIGRTTSTTADTIGGVINKMAKSLAVANEESKGAAQAVKALGLDFEAFKRLQGDQQLLSLAQAMARFEDGGGKSAAAMALMGREGARLLPFMKDLASAGELVATVTTAQAEMADRYNDSMEVTRMRVDAVKRELALGLLPTLIDLHDLTGDLGKAWSDWLAGGAKTAAGDADVLAVALGGVGTVMETLLVLGANTSFVFKTMGRDMGASAAAFVEMQRWNFDGARTILRQAKEDAAADRAALDEFERRVLGATDRALQARAALRGSPVTAADDARELARMDRLAGRAALGRLNFSGGDDEAAKAAKRHADEVQKLFEKLGLRSTQQAAELQTTAQLTAAQKEAYEVMERMRTGTLVLTAAEQQRLAGQLTLIDTQERQLAIRRSEAQLLADMAKDREQIVIDITAETQRLQEQTDAQRDQLLSLALGAKGYSELQAARLRNRAGELEAIATTSEMSAELLKQAALLREQAGLVHARADLSGAVAKPLGADVYTEVRGALADAFRDTKNPIKAFADALGNAVYTRVTSNLADSLATQLVGTSGTGGLLGSVLGLFTGGVPVGDGLGSTGDFARFDRAATPLAKGIDNVPHDNFRALLHKGERVVPAAENTAAASRPSITLAPVNNIHIEARTDKAQVQQLVEEGVARGNRATFEELHLMGVI